VRLTSTKIWRAARLFRAHAITEMKYIHEHMRICARAIKFICFAFAHAVRNDARNSGAAEAHRKSAPPRRRALGRRRDLRGGVKVSAMPPGRAPVAEVNTRRWLFSSPGYRRCRPKGSLSRRRVGVLFAQRPSRDNGLRQNPKRGDRAPGRRQNNPRSSAMTAPMTAL